MKGNLKGLSPPEATLSAPSKEIFLLSFEEEVADLTRRGEKGGEIDKF
jgi:hypothetical protein